MTNGTTASHPEPDRELDNLASRINTDYAEIQKVEKEATRLNANVAERALAPRQYQAAECLTLAGIHKSPAK